MFVCIYRKIFPQRPPPGRPQLQDGQPSDYIYEHFNNEAFIILWFFWFFILRKETVEESAERGCISEVSTKYQVIRLLEEWISWKYLCFSLFVITVFSYLYKKYYSPISYPRKESFFDWGVLVILCSRYCSGCHVFRYIWSYYVACNNNYNYKVTMSILTAAICYTCSSTRTIVLNSKTQNLTLYFLGAINSDLAFVLIKFS